MNMTGWDANDCGMSKVVNEVTLPIFGDEAAEDFFGILDWDRIICIDTTGGGGTCSGTSGPSHGLWSFGCYFGVPMCFTAIPSYLDWLNENRK